MSDFQSASRKFHSSETDLLRIQNDILVSLDSGHSIALLLLDLSAAFDTIDHNILLHHLNTGLILHLLFHRYHRFSLIVFKL